MRSSLLGLALLACLGIVAAKPASACKLLGHRFFRVQCPRVAWCVPMDCYIPQDRCVAPEAEPEAATPDETATPAPAPMESPSDAAPEAPVEAPAPAPAPEVAPAPEAPAAPGAEMPAPSEPAAPEAPAEAPAPAVGPAETPAPPAPAESPAPEAPATEAAPAAEAPAAPAQSGYRIWTDESGMYRITARFVQTIDGEIVRLRTPSGAFVRVAWDRLSQADRDYVIRLGGVAANLR